MKKKKKKTPGIWGVTIPNRFLKKKMVFLKKEKKKKRVLPSSENTREKCRIHKVVKRLISEKIKIKSSKATK